MNRDLGRERRTFQFLSASRRKTEGKKVICLAQDWGESETAYYTRLMVGQS